MPYSGNSWWSRPGPNPALFFTTTPQAGTQRLMKLQREHYDADYLGDCARP
jgi:hypothetical protein